MSPGSAQTQDATPPDPMLNQTRRTLPARKVMPEPKTSIRQSLVIFAKNKRRVSDFCRRTLGLAAIEEESTHDLLRGRGIRLVIHAVPRKYSTQINITKPPQVREDTPLKPAFFVRSLDAVRLAAESAGGSLQPMDMAWQYNGATVLDGCDPEGNVVRFTQHDAKSRARL